jgi:hypothetical protein
MTPSLAVFIPGIMGAGIIVSIVMLVSDGLRRLVPVRGARARAVHIATRTQARVHDLVSVRTGEPPLPATVSRVPRPRAVSLALGALALAGAGAIMVGAVVVYRGHGSVWSGRGWPLGVGLALALPLGLAGLVLLSSGVLGPRRPGWLDRLARTEPLGVLPDPETIGLPSTLPQEV